MKMIRYVVLLGLCGCSNLHLDKVAKELAKDNATVVIDVRTIYGTVIFTRTNPGTNTLSHTVSDGKVTISK